MFNPLRKLFSYKAHYQAPKDSSLRSKPVKPEPKWKEPSYKNYNWGRGVGK